MKKSLGSFLALAVLLALPASAALQKGAGHGGQAPMASTKGAPVLLYSQNNSPAGNGAPDQDFEASFNAYDSEGADDFIVTDATGWTVEQIRTVGTTGTPGGATVKVTFLDNSPGGGDPDLPGAAVAGCSYTGIVPTDNLGSLTIDLPAPCILPMGTYWVAIQVNQNFGSFGQHFWSNRTIQSNSESVWRNPGDGFASGCTTFTPQTTCGVGGGTNPDFLFEVWGQLGGAGGDVSITKTGVDLGGQIVYTISVANAGPGDANNVVVTDTLPAEVSYVSDTCGGTNTPPWTWNAGTILANNSASCDITVSVVTPGAIVNTASVTADGDGNTANNTSTATVQGTLGGNPPGIPTLDTIGLVILFALLAAAALIMVRRRARA